MLKGILSFTLFFLSLSVLAVNKINVGTFSIFEGNDKNFYIQKKKEMNGHLPSFEKEKEFQMMQLNVSGGSTKINGTFIPKEAPHLVFVIYYAGETGTSKLVKDYRCAIYNTNTFKFVGDVPYRSVLIEEGKEKKGMTLKYVFKEGMLEVYERSVLLKTVKTNIP